VWLALYVVGLGLTYTAILECLYNGDAWKILQVVLGKLALEETGYSIAVISLLLFVVVVYGALLVPMLWTAGSLRKWGVFTLVNMARENIKKDKEQCLKDGCESTRLNWWIDQITLIEDLYSEVKESADAEKGLS
jgi:hypothetical protein